jgi:hypothetical protein
MEEAATTPVSQSTTNTGNGSSNNNSERPTQNKVVGKNTAPRQNFNNRQNNNNNSVGPNDKNPRRGKRYRKAPNDTNSTGGPVKPPGQGEDNRSGSSNTATSSSNPSVRAATPTTAGVGKTWSKIVSSSYDQNGFQSESQPPTSQPPTSQPFKQPDPQVNSHTPNNQENNNNKRQNRSKKNANKFEEKKGKTEEPENFNPDEKIEAIQIQLKQTLNDMQTKADHLKHLQEQINAIKLERDGKIDELHTERANLIIDLQKLKSELTDTENQIANINATTSQLKSNRIQKIRSLEDHSRALLNDKAI